MPKLLTDRFLEGVKAPAEGRLDIVDTKAKGLTLRITAAGTKSWSIRYRPKGQDQKRIGYGAWPTMTLAKARQRATEIEAAAMAGRDLPAEEDAARKAAEAASRTVADLVGSFLDGHVKPNQRRWEQTERMLDQHVIPKLGDKPIVSVKREHIAELLDGLQNEKGLKAQVNRVRSQLTLMFGWAVERGLAEHNPVATIKKRKVEQAGERVLSHDELRAVWNAADALGEPSRSLVMTWILTGMRRDEARCAPPTEIDLKRSIWVIPAARNKSKRDFELPLSTAMVELLKPLVKRGKFVFSTSGEKPYAGTRGLKVILDRESGVKGWVFHDLRRTVRSGLAEIGIAEEVAERVLNHALVGLNRVYNRHLYAEEKRSALQAWADHVALIVSKGHEAPNVHQFTGRVAAAVK